jgi:large subunit ribosomal protein L28
MFGHNISHAHNVTKRKFMPNLHRVRVRVNGRVKRIRVCTRCLKAGKVHKV